MNIKIKHIEYGAMKIAIESRTKDNVNYEIKITDITLGKHNRVFDNVVAVLKFNTLNPDSLKTITRSKSYSQDMSTDIIRTSLYSTFANVNINKTADNLTTSIEKANVLALRKAEKNLKTHISQPKVINM